MENPSGTGKKDLGLFFAGLFVGLTVACIGNIVALAAQLPSAWGGVAFFGAIAGVVYRWRTLGRNGLTTVVATYLCGLATYEALTLHWPHLLAPLLCGTITFAFGIVLREIINARKAP